MPGFIPAAGAVRVALEFRLGSHSAFNVINVNKGSAATPADLVAIAAVFQNWWNTQLRTYVSDQVVFISATLTALDAPGSPFLVAPNTGPASGALGFNAMPPNVALAISFTCGVSGRSYRGRAYMFGLVTVITQNAGVIDPGNIANIRAIWVALYNALITAGFPLCIASFYSGKDLAGNKIPRAAAVLTNVTSVTVKARFDTQRRRLPRE